MRSIYDPVAPATSRESQDKRAASPIACALFIAALAVGVTGGTLWLTSAVVNNNAQAAAAILAYE